MTNTSIHVYIILKLYITYAWGTITHYSATFPKFYELNREDKRSPFVLELILSCIKPIGQMVIFKPINNCVGKKSHNLYYRRCTQPLGQTD